MDRFLLLENVRKTILALEGGKIGGLHIEMRVYLFSVPEVKLFGIALSALLSHALRMGGPPQLKYTERNNRFLGQFGPKK